MKKEYLFVLMILCLALLVRVYTVYSVIDFRENTDILRYKDWARIAFLYGFSESYKSAYLQFGTLPNNQPPGLLYILYGMYIIGIQISKAVLAVTQASEGSLMRLNVSLMTALFRIPAIVSDLLTGIGIYIILKKITSKNVLPFIGMALFLFNPVVLYNSTIWGQVDSVVNCLFLFSLYFIMQNSTCSSMGAFAGSLFVKFSLLYNLPFMVILWTRKTSKRTLFFYFAMIFCLICILTLPVDGNPIRWMTTFIQNNAVGEMNAITAFALNGWWMIFRPQAIPEGTDNSYVLSVMHMVGSPADGTKFIGVPLFWFGIALFFFLTVPIAIRMAREKIERVQLVRYFFIIALVGFLVLPRMHERYLYPVFPLLTILSVGSPAYLTGLIALSVLHMINLYIVYHPFFISFFPYQFWMERDFQWVISVLTVIIGIYFYIIVLFPNTKKNRNI